MGSIIDLRLRVTKGVAMERRSQVVRRFVGIIGCALVLLGLGVHEAHAERVGKSHNQGLRNEIAILRAQIAEMKGQMAQLHTAIDFQGRRAEAAQSLLPGGICGDPCANDGDGDGVNDCEDACPCDPNNADSDGDQMPDCYDPCPDDATNACIDPCRTDSDGDGQGDCEDPCPYDPNPPTDGDGDQIPDCQDPCLNDPSNSCSDPCPLDQDGDGVTDCNDTCPWVYGPNGTSPLVCQYPVSTEAAGAVRR
jgi:hypothetical protein